MKNIVLVSISIFGLIYSASASGVKGIFSCSSGVNNSKPITYVFNQDLMIRNDDKTLPFEYLSSLNNGRILYIGYVFDEALYRSNFSLWPIEDDRLELFAVTALSNKNITSPKTKSDYLLYHALRCSYVGNGSFYKLFKENKYILEEINKTDQSNLDVNDIEICDYSLKYSQSLNITDIRKYFIDRNRKRALRTSLDTTIITVDTNNAIVWETQLYRPNKKPVYYNCSVLNIDVPEIKPPSEPITKNNEV